MEDLRLRRHCHVQRKPQRLQAPLKIANTPLGRASGNAQPSRIASAWKGLTPPSGLYFFYGTLQSPQIFAEILGLRTPPKLKLAHVVGYDVKLWVQYPAVVDGPAGNIINGHAFEVPDDAAAAKLAVYETRSYYSPSCQIHLDDGRFSQTQQVEGFMFKFYGNLNELSEGNFGLQTWLRRMGRFKEAKLLAE